MIQAVVFDLDGVLVDSEQVWDGARRVVADRHGGTWTTEATGDMQGMSAPEWSRYMADRLGVGLDAARIGDLVVEEVLGRYADEVPLLPGALEAVDRLARRWPLGLASSANRTVIERVLDAAGLQDRFEVVVSSEEVPRGKPSPDVYLETTRRLHQPPRACAAVEDSSNGIRAALAAGLHTVAVPNRAFPPDPDVLTGADLAIGRLDELTVTVVAALGAGEDPFESRVDQEEEESFPASDPHSDWAGPPG